jgi:hypothetical protein
VPGAPSGHRHLDIFEPVSLCVGEMPYSRSHPFQEQPLILGHSAEGAVEMLTIEHDLLSGCQIAQPLCVLAEGKLSARPDLFDDIGSSTQDLGLGRTTTSCRKLGQHLQPSAQVCPSLDTIGRLVTLRSR